MEYEEVLSYIDKLIKVLQGTERDSLLANIVWKIRTALKKQVQENPIVNKPIENEEIYSFCCPRCGVQILEFDKPNNIESGHTQSFCEDCGQAIKWTDYEILKF